MLQKNKKAFSILEVLVWIFIFSMWIVSIYSLIITTLKLNDYNKNFIIASNLAREQIELVRNIRDSNYEEIRNYNQLTPFDSRKFETWEYYKIENDYSGLTSFPVKVEKIIDFDEWKDELGWKMQYYRLCIDDDNRYTYDCSGNKKTIFYKFIKIEDAEYNDSWVKKIEDAFKVTSKVIWYQKWYHEYEVKSIITDYKTL